MQGRPRKRKESRRNTNGEIRYNAKTETWKCAQRGGIYSSNESRGAASHVAVRTREIRRRRLLQEEHVIVGMPTETKKKQKLEPYYNTEQG